MARDRQDPCALVEHPPRLDHVAVLFGLSKELNGRLASHDGSLREYPEQGDQGRYGGGDENGLDLIQAKPGS